MALNFRLATAIDAARLNALVNSVYRGESSKVGWTTEAELLGGQRTDAEGLTTLINTSDHAILLAEEAGALVGCVHLSKKNLDTCYLGMLSVQAELQSRGTGRELLAAGEAFAKTQWRCTRVEMTVIGQRPELIDYYVRRGYRSSGERRAFPMDDPRFGIPKRKDLYFKVLLKDL